MYIISKFKDYYDIGSGLGIDKTNVYKRVEEALTLNDINNEHPDLNAFESPGHRRIYYSRLNYFKPYIKNYTSRTSRRVYMYSDWLFKKHIIAVCGKLYSVLLFTEESTSSSKCHIFHNYDQVKEHLIKNGKSVPKKDSFKGKNFCLFDRLFINNEVLESDINIFYKTPILSYTLSSRYDESIKLTLNPELNKFEFYRVLDPYTMFQEVSMYNSGVLTNTEDNMVQISDEDKKFAKGFDDYSFKKLPTKRKFKRRIKGRC